VSYLEDASQEARSAIPEQKFLGAIDATLHVNAYPTNNPLKKKKKKKICVGQRSKLQKLQKKNLSFWQDNFICPFDSLSFVVSFFLFFFCFGSTTKWSIIVIYYVSFGSPIILFDFFLVFFFLKKLSIFLLFLFVGRVEMKGLASHIFTYEC